MSTTSVLAPQMARFRLLLSVSVLILMSCGGDSPGSARPSSPGTSPSALPVLVEGETLSAERYVVGLLRAEGLEVTFEAEGWGAWAYGATGPEGAGPPGGRGIGFWVVDEVIAHPCEWNRGPIEPPVGPSVTDLAAALTQQQGAAASEPEPVELAGYEGLKVRLQAPSSIDLKDCWDEEFHRWTARPAGGRYIQGPGQIEMLWILDVEGTRLVIDAVWFPATTGEDRDELMRIVESVRIE